MHFSLLLFIAMMAQDGQPHKNAVVYKCKDANGVTVFSQSPCSNDPTKVQQVDTSAALRVKGSDTSAIQAMSNGVAISNIDIKCASRKNAIAASYQSQLSSIDSEISELRRSKRFSNNNTAGATRDVQIETRISGLEQRKNVLIQARLQEQSFAQSDCDREAEAELKRQQQQQSAQKEMAVKPSTDAGNTQPAPN